jgi:hypothetical protein
VLQTSLPPSDVAAVLSNSGTNSGLTRDRAKPQQAILNFRVRSIYQHDSGECPNVGYYQGDLIVNKSDGMALQAAKEQALSCLHLPSDPMSIQTATHLAEQAAHRAVAIGAQNFRTNLGFLKVVSAKSARCRANASSFLFRPAF